MIGASKQEDLDAEYRADWLTLVEHWVGLNYSPGRTQSVKLQQESLSFYEDSNVPTEVTISESVPCDNAGIARSCVTVSSTLRPEYKVRDEAASRYERHILRSKLVVEPDSLFPHSWVEEVWTSASAAEGRPAMDLLKTRKERLFDCRAGS